MINRLSIRDSIIYDTFGRNSEIFRLRSVRQRLYEGLPAKEENSLLCSRFKPAVSKYWLAATAGLMWSTVGFMLCGLAYEWLVIVPFLWAGSLGAAGVVLALAFYNLSFSKIALKNIERLRQFPDRYVFLPSRPGKAIC